MSERDGLRTAIAKAMHSEMFDGTSARGTYDLTAYAIADRLLELPEMAAALSDAGAPPVFEPEANRECAACGEPVFCQSCGEGDYERMREDAAEA